MYEKKGFCNNLGGDDRLCSYYVKQPYSQDLAWTTCRPDIPLNKSQVMTGNALCVGSHGTPRRVWRQLVLIRTKCLILYPAARRDGVMSAACL